MIGNEMSLFHKGTKFDKTQHNYIGGKCIGLIMGSILAVIGILNHRGEVRLRVLIFFFKIKLLQAMLNQDGKEYFNLIISHFSTT